VVSVTSLSRRPLTVPSPPALTAAQHQHYLSHRSLETLRLAALNQRNVTEPHITGTWHIVPI